MVDSYKLFYPDYELNFGCPTELLPLAKNYPTIDKLWDSKDLRKAREDFNAYYDVTHPCVQYETITQPYVDKSRLEIWARRVGLPYYNLRFRNHTKAEDIEASYRLVPREWDKQFIVGIISRTHDPTRMFDGWERTRLELIKLFRPDIRFIVIRGARRGPEWSDFFWRDEARVIIDQDKILSLALLNRCNVVVGSDTGPMHSASIFGVPTVWLFGPTDGRIRAKEYTKTTIIQKRAYCDMMPCWYLHCWKKDTEWDSYCMQMIRPHDIVQAIEPHYRRYKNVEC
jgi:hypothetical protein